MGLSGPQEKATIRDEATVAYRLVATVDGKAVRFPLPPGEYQLGSHASAALRVYHPSVSRRHATLTVDREAVVVRDEGSRNGTCVNGRRIEVARIEPGVPVTFGSVSAFLERVPDDDLMLGVPLPDSGLVASEPPGTPPDQTTFRSGVVEAFALERLPALLRRIAAGGSEIAMAQLVGEAVYGGLPCAEVTIAAGRDPAAGVVFHAARPFPGAGDREPVVAPVGRLTLSAWFPGPALAASFRPLLEALAGLVTRADVATPIGSAAPPTPPPLPDPPTVVPAMRQIYEAAARVARGKVSVLILGESGTGKEVLARYLHAASPEASGSFLALNCASLPRDLLESELFGIERGVATGVDARPGKFELAAGGVLLLDEIGDMALDTQAKILRVLQSGEVFRLGSREPRRVDVRVVAATNRDIRSMLAAGSFRTDLYYRIAGWVVHLPPLRQRRADLANMAVHFLAAAAGARGARVAGISRAALAALTAYEWPGNVRQLANEMARAALFLDDGELLDTARLSEEIRGGGVTAEDATLAGALGRAEHGRIVAVLAECGGSVAAAADRLGVNRATLYRRMKRLGLDTPGK
jgi:transcriptional regulator with AAA-type ATPase domain